MSSFVEKIGEKLHLGGHKKDEQLHNGHATGEPHAHAVGHAGEHVVAHPEHVESAGYGDHKKAEQLHDGHGTGEHVVAYPERVEPAGHGGQYGQGEPHVHGAAEVPAAHGVQAAAPHHDGPLEKVKNKIKGPKKHEGDDSSSSSSESDGEGGRRKKKHGPF